MLEHYIWPALPHTNRKPRNPSNPGALSCGIIFFVKIYSIFPFINIWSRYSFIYAFIKIHFLFSSLCVNVRLDLRI